MLGGFSMGSVMSYALGPRPGPPGAGRDPRLLRLRPDRRGLAARPRRRARTCAAFIAHGRRDPIMEVGFARRARELLEAGGLRRRVPRVRRRPPHRPGARPGGGRLAGGHGVRQAGRDGRALHPAMTASVAPLLRAAVERGDWSRLRERLAEDAVLRHEQRGRPPARRRRRRDRRPPRAARSGRGRPWDAAGVAAGRRADLRVGGRDRHGPAPLVRADRTRRPGDRAVERGRAPGTRRGCRGRARPPPALLAQLGATRVAPLATAATRARRSLRARRATTARRSSLKRVTAEAPTGSPARPATTGARRGSTLAGAFDAMPPAIEPRHRRRRALDGDAAWIAMRDVSGAQLLAPDARLSREREPAHPRRGRGSSIAAFRGARARRCRDAERPHRHVLARPWPTRSGADPDLLPKQFEHGWDAFARGRRRPTWPTPVLALAARARRRWPTRCRRPRRRRRSSTATCATTTSASTATASC